MCATIQYSDINISDFFKIRDQNNILRQTMREPYVPDENMFLGKPDDGKCPCASQHLSDLMSEKIIHIIDEYSHRADNIINAIVDDLMRDHIITWDEDSKLCAAIRERKDTGQDIGQDELYLGGLWIRQKIRQKWSERTGVRDASWIFAGDHLGKSNFDMCEFSSQNRLLDNAATCVIRLSESLEAPVIYIGGSYIESRWGGACFTPFARKNRRLLKQFVNQDVFEVEQCMTHNPFDVMCDIANAAIWTWFHCGDPADVSI